MLDHLKRPISWPWKKPKWAPTLCATHPDIFQWLPLARLNLHSHYKGRVSLCLGALYVSSLVLSTWKAGHRLGHPAIHLSQMCHTPLGLVYGEDTWSLSREPAPPCRGSHLWQQVHLFLMIASRKEQSSYNLSISCFAQIGFSIFLWFLNNLV